MQLNPPVQSEELSTLCFLDNLVKSKYRHPVISFAVLHKTDSVKACLLTDWLPLFGEI